MSTRLRTTLAAALLSGIVLGAAPAQAPGPPSDPGDPDPGSQEQIWYRHYEFGLRAIESSEWRRAIDELRAAIEGRPEPSGNARTYRMRFIDYFPYYYLGAAHYSLGETDRAREYLERELEHGEILETERAPDIRTLLAATEGPRGSAEVIESAEEKEREELRERLDRGVALFEEGRFREAVSELVSVLAVDSANASAREYLERARRGALREELAELSVAAPDAGGGPEVDLTSLLDIPDLDQQVAVPEVEEPEPEPAPEAETVEEEEEATPEEEAAEEKAPPEEEEAPPEEEEAPPEEEAPASEAAAVESVAWSLYSQGRDLVDAGRLEDAAGKFLTVITMLESVGGSGHLRDEARAHYDAVQAEIQRRAEARKSAEIARLQAEIEELRKSKPEIAFLSPPELQEPYDEPIIKVQGVVLDRHGVADIEVEVNGKVWGKPQFGRSGTRNIEVVPTAGADAVMGTQVNFHQQVTLQEGENEVVVRARNIDGLEAESRRKIRHEEKEGQVWAAVIGVSEYSHDSIPDLAYATADARAFTEYLREDLGVPDDHVFELLDGDVTDRSMRAVLGETIRDRAGPEDMVIIYYAGHGAPESDPNDPDGDGAEKYLVPSDAHPDQLFSTAFSMSNVAQIFARLPAGRILFIADACYSGAAGGGRTFGTGISSRISDNFLRRLGGSGRVILTAAMGNQLSYERSDLGHGVFTYHLLEGLRGPADRNADGTITVTEAYDYVSEKVAEETRNKQVPMMRGELGGRIPLARVSGR